MTNTFLSMLRERVLNRKEELNKLLPNAPEEAVTNMIVDWVEVEIIQILNKDKRTKEKKGE